MDAFGVRCFGSVISASLLADATLASRLLELTTLSLVQIRVMQIRKRAILWMTLFSYRNSEIRTHDLLLPKQALYQAELYSVLFLS